MLLTAAPRLQGAGALITNSTKRIHKGQCLPFNQERKGPDDHPPNTASSNQDKCILQWWIKLLIERMEDLTVWREKGPLTMRICPWANLLYIVMVIILYDYSSLIIISISTFNMKKLVSFSFMKTNKNIFNNH